MSLEPRILVIDDEPRICESLKVLLEGYGYEVHTAPGGTKGLECLSNSPFSLVVTDIVLPDADGLALMDYIKSNYPDTLVIVMTGHVSVQSAIDALRKGAYDYLIKPFDPDKLEPMIQRAMDQVRLRLQLKVSERRYFKLIKDCPDAIIIDKDGKAVFANDAYFSLIGYPKEEVLGEETFKYIDKANSHKVRTDKKDGLICDLKYVGKDGTGKVAEIISKGIIWEGEPATMIFARDVTKRKEAEEALRRSEEKYREVVENSLVGIYIRQDDTIKFVNNTFAKMFGYTREELLGANFWKLVHPEDIELVKAIGMKRLQGKPAPSQYEARGIKKTGETIWVNRRNVCIEHEGRPAILGNIVDITERKQMEEQLLQSEKLRAMGEMASGIAHDFNNTLAAILGNTQLLLSTVKDTDLHRRLKNIEIAAHDASQTVKRLQEFTRIRKDDKDFEQIDILKLIDDVISITKPRWKDQHQEKGITVDLVTDLKWVPPIAGHPSEIREVLTNLIFNALDAMPEGGTLTIGTRHVCEWTDSDPEKDGLVEISLSDTGRGMSLEVRKKIFDPFFTTKGVNHSGLGLSVSYGIISRHGGEILVDSKEGEGTTFIIRLPVSLDARERVEKKIGMKKCGKKARILVIEDDIMVSSVLEEMLSSVGHHVTTAPNGREGIEQFKNNSFDMVFTDLGMPEMSGWDVARFIKETDPKVPVAMITGWGVEFDQKQLRDAGVDLIVAKPFSIDRIVSLVAEATEVKGTV